MWEGYLYTFMFFEQYGSLSIGHRCERGSFAAPVCKLFRYFDVFWISPIFWVVVPT